MSAPATAKLAGTIAEMSPILLDAKDVCVSFGAVHVLDHLDFAMREGEVTAIIGPNGAGKTTFFDVLMNMVPEATGRVLFGPEGTDLLKLPTYRIARLGIARTFQTLRLFHNLTVLENVMAATTPRGEARFAGSFLGLPSARSAYRARVEECLEVLSMFGERLLSMCNEPATSLSYANRRRLEIARTVAARPRLILLDEPVAGMNPSETQEISEDILRVKERYGTTILLIEHDLTFVGGVADRVVLFAEGQSRIEGAFDDVIRDLTVVDAYLGRRHRPQNISPRRARQANETTHEATGNTFAMEQFDKIIADRFPDLRDVDDDLDLIRSGALSSVHFIELVVALEEALGVEIPDEDVVESNFSTKGRIKGYLQGLADA